MYGQYDIPHPHPFMDFPPPAQMLNSPHLYSRPMLYHSYEPNSHHNMPQLANNLPAPG
jgi:hypothetical protein